MSTTRQHLNQFYVELQAWIDGGCGEHPIFRLDYPICDNLSDWEAREDDRYGVWKVLRQQLRDAFQTAYNPFDQDGDIGEACAEGTLYQNPARLAWIKAHADAAKAAGQEAA